MVGHDDRPFAGAVGPGELALDEGSLGAVPLDALPGREVTAAVADCTHEVRDAAAKEEVGRRGLGWPLECEIGPERCADEADAVDLHCARVEEVDPCFAALLGDPPHPPANTPLVAIRRRQDRRPEVTVTEGRARIRLLGE